MIHAETIILILSVIYYIIIIVLVVKILLENRKPIYSAALIGMLIVFPIVGLILFMFLAYKMNKSTFVSKKWHQERKKIGLWKSEMYAQIEEKSTKRNSPIKEWNKIINMLYLFDNASPTYNNDVKLLINGEEFYANLIEDLKNAKNHIHLEFYIFDNDDIGNEIINILLQKVQEGVKIRFIIDSFGSRSINKKMFKLLRENNIEVFSFLPLFTPKLFRFVNIRDHRKLVVIDGDIAYTGGMNIADRYINNGNPRNKRFWRDTAVRVCGDAVKSFQLQFFNIWKFVSKQEEIFEMEIYSGNYTTEKECITQLVDSGPDSEYQSILNTLFIAITNAEKEIMIETPYFSPPDEIIMALQNAALSGVDVKIIIPERSDNKITTSASYSYIDSLASVGVKFYIYKKGFIHSKVTIVDNTFSTVGSTNYDYRSFNSNYELNAIFYDKHFNSEMRKMFNDDLTNCEQIILSEWKKRSLFVKIRDSICRLFAPLL
ncbi:cardiolipin synthase [Bacteroidales bacterium OttesenSCG-928-K03]|nr:cardiolipin synthase [Bacteroidales bacterium OttesenSCG-928-L14]MDL2241095.1 cardiolipin synthase [Bacteroidales bacterium OttesenSCG-928-K22]MDL2242864.1 cardiolipin synthase [Bacteroidales bacterium OttesenSCG-928-K03]